MPDADVLIHVFLILRQRQTLNLFSNLSKPLLLYVL